MSEYILRAVTADDLQHVLTITSLEASRENFHRLCDITEMSFQFVMDLLERINCDDIPQGLFDELFDFTLKHHRAISERLTLMRENNADMQQTIDKIDRLWKEALKREKGL